MLLLFGTVNAFPRASRISCVLQKIATGVSGGLCDH